MLVVDNAIFAVAQVLLGLTKVYFWIIVAAAVVSWVRPDPYNPIVRTLYALTEPVFYRVRRLLPFTYAAGIDFSPIVVIVILQLFENIVIKSLMQYASGM